MNPIGRIHSAFTDKDGIPRQPHVVSDLTAELIIQPDIPIEAFDELSGWSHFWIIYFFHIRPKFTPLVQPPATSSGKIESRGVYSTRAPHRVNPIGLTLVKFIKMEGRVITFQGVDMADQTPVLDIKPFHCISDIPDNPFMPEWVVRQNTPLLVKLAEGVVVPALTNNSIIQLIRVIGAHPLQRWTLGSDKPEDHKMVSFAWHNFYAETRYDSKNNIIVLENFLTLNHWELKQLKAEQVEYLKHNPTNQATTPENLPKNRYGIAVPYNFNRIKLMSDDRYINASRIHIDDFTCIAAQAPLPNTVEDFWDMIWQEQISCILMLTPLIEENEVKSEKYFPDGSPGLLDIGSYSIIRSVSTDSPNSSYQINRLKIVKKGEIEERNLTHIYYNSWPDKQPLSTDNQVIDQICQLFSQYDTGKTVVHCSAGIARTGTFLAYYLTWMMKQRKINFRTNRELVSTLRQQRVGLVQNEAQYDSTVAYRKYLSID